MSWISILLIFNLKGYVSEKTLISSSPLNTGCFFYQHNKAVEDKTTDKFYSFYI